MNRAPVGTPLHLMETFAIASPVQTHTRVATCEEVGCAAHAHGWATVVDEDSPFGQMQAALIRRTCVRDGGNLRPDVLGGRRYFREGLAAPGAPTRFVFPAGQACFEEHRVPLDRPALYVVRDGDWRGNPTGRRRVHSRPEHWVEEFATTQQQLLNMRERG